MKQFNNFKEFVATNIKKLLPEEFQNATVEFHDVTTSTRHYAGMTVTKPGQIVVPTINLNQLYEFYETHTLQETLEMAAEIAQVTIPEGVTYVERLEDYKYIKDKLVLKVVSTSENFLADKVYKTVEDLAIVPFIFAENGEDAVTAAITKALLDGYGISEEELFADAFMSAPKILPKSIKTMRDVMEEMLGCAIPDDVPEFYVVSNDTHLNGAAALFYPGVQQELAEIVGESYYVLPSSKHEMLICPYSEGDIDNLISMVIAANSDETAVSPEDKLVDSVYKYDAEAKSFKKVA